MYTVYFIIFCTQKLSLHLIYYKHVNHNLYLAQCFAIISLFINSKKYQLAEFIALEAFHVKIIDRFHLNAIECNNVLILV